MSSATEAIKAMNDRDLLKETLTSSLFHSFLNAGYEPEECAKLTNIAIGPVHHALELSQAAYKLHLEALHTGLISKVWPPR